MAMQLHCVIKKSLQYRRKSSLLPSTHSVSQGTEVTLVTKYVFMHITEYTDKSI